MMIMQCSLCMLFSYSFRLRAYHRIIWPCLPMTSDSKKNSIPLSLLLNQPPFCSLPSQGRLKLIVHFPDGLRSLRTFRSHRLHIVHQFPKSRNLRSNRFVLGLQVRVTPHVFDGIFALQFFQVQFNLMAIVLEVIAVFFELIALFFDPL